MDCKMQATSGKRTTPASCPSNGAVFFCLDNDRRTSGRGDVFAVLGDDEVKSFEQMLEKRYTFRRLAVLGFEEGGDGHLVFLNRVLTVDVKSRPWMVVCEPDSRYAKLLIRELEVEKATGADQQNTEVRINNIWIRNLNLWMMN